MKYINFKRYKFSTVLKYLNTLSRNFFKIFKFISNENYNFRKIFRYFQFRKFNNINIIKYLKLKNYNINLIKKLNFFSNKFFIVHLPVSIIFFGFLYLAIPTFYSYDKTYIEKKMCANQNVQCLIRGEINYKFYPTPRIKIKDLNRLLVLLAILV